MYHNDMAMGEPIKLKKNYFGIAGTREREITKCWLRVLPHSGARLDLAMFSSCSVSARAACIFA